jgi:hypothetical protein
MQVGYWTLAFFAFSSVAQVGNLRYATRGEHNFRQTPTGYKRLRPFCNRIMAYLLIQ